MPHGIGHQLGGQEFGDVDEADHWVNAAKIVSTMSSVSVPQLATGGGAFPLQTTGVAIMRRHGLASRFALVGGR
jgi:hypothetical protein